MIHRTEQHFEAGPSRLDRVIACPASVVASRGIPAAPAAAAEHGKRLHWLLEHCLREARLPADIPADGEWASYSADDRDAVEAVIRYVEDLTDEHPGERLIEADVDLSAHFPGLFGRVDLAVISGATLIVLDAKFGRAPVAATTAQLKAYALGLLDAYAYLTFDQVICVIAQPFVQHFDEARYTPNQLAAWASEVMAPALQEAFGPAPRFNPTLDACQYCPARAVCAARKAAHYDAVAAALTGAPEVALLTADEIAALLPGFDAFEAYINDVRDHAVRELLAGRPIQGFKVVEGRSVRKWSDPASAINGLLAALVAKRPDLTPAAAADLVAAKAPITITAAEKLLGRGHPCFASLTVKPQGKPMLAPESDTRPIFAAAAAVADALDAIVV